MADSNTSGSGDSSDNKPQAKAKMPTFIANVAATVTQRVSHGSLLMWALLVLAVLAIFRLIIPKFISEVKFVIPWAGIFSFLVVAGLFIFIIWGAVTGLKNGKSVRIWVAGALLIWAMDLTPSSFPIIGKILGPSYSGFFIDWQGIKEISFLSIASSGIFFALLYVNMVYDIIKKEYIAFIGGFLSIVLINSLIAKFFPVFSIPGIRVPWWQIIFLGIAILGIISILLLRWFGKKVGGQEGQISDFLSYLYMTFIFSFFWINDSWKLNTKAWIHAWFIVAFGFAYIRKQEQDNPALWHILVPTLLIIDFYGAGLLWTTDYLVLKFIPLLVLFVITYCYVKTEDGYSIFTFIGIITIMLILSVQAYGYEPQGEVQFNARQGETSESFLNTLWAGIVSQTTNKLDEASGGYFKSKVEKNQYESLGVYFSDVRASQPVFYDDEPVTLWTTIKSRTLSEPVAVNFSCSRWKEGVRIRPNTEKDPKDNIYPNYTFTVFTFEDTDAECTFNQDSNSTKLDLGQNTITLSATYNFATSAYQKLYFIDRERLRTLTRENIDPLKEFGITEREPPTIHTNGPVELAASTQYLIPVSAGATINPNLGILLRNRNIITGKDGKPLGQWTGKIKKINELIVVLPNGMELEDPASCRPAPFDLVDKAALCTKDNWCKTCEKTCENEKDETKCVKLCAETCIEECNSVFKDDSNPAANKDKLSYNAYRMKTELLYKDNADYVNVDQSRHLTFGCRIKVSPDILENTPITTKYVRVLSRYDYSIDQSFSVNVVQSPYPAYTTHQGPAPTILSLCKDFGSNEKIFLEGYNKYASQIKEAAKILEGKVSSPEALIAAIISQESRWDAAIKGPCGAVGIGQFIPATARGYGLNVPVYAQTSTCCIDTLPERKAEEPNLRVSECNSCNPSACTSDDERFNPDKAIEAIAKYMEVLVGECGGSVEGAIIKYNHGKSCSKPTDANYNTYVLKYYNQWQNCFALAST